MPLTFKINSRDLEPYLRLQHDAGFDPVNAGHVEPQFSGNLALSEGMNWVKDSAGNKEWAVPLHLEAASADALTELVRDIRSDLFKGAQVEFKLEGSTSPTFFDLERGRLDETFEYFIVAHNSLRATLRLWTRPYGHTGTSRIVASTVGTGYVVTLASGAIGDRDALANMRVKYGAVHAIGRDLALYAVHPQPSFPFLRRHNAVATIHGGAVTGASGAIGSQFQAIPLIPTSSEVTWVTDYLSPDHHGRHRILAFLKHRLHPATALRVYAEDDQGNRLGPTYTASQNDAGNWTVIDLGEVVVTATALNSERAAATRTIKLVFGGASGASAIASPALHFNAISYVPADTSVGLAAGAVGDGASRYMHFDAYPCADFYTTKSGTEVIWDEAAAARGGDPRVPVPSGCGVFALAGNVDRYVGNNQVGLSVKVRERFSFLR
jgi:hypothetical protein